MHSIMLIESLMKAETRKDCKENPRLGPFKDSLNKKLSVYFGQYRNGKKEGLGKMLLENGYYVEGDWRNDKPTGRLRQIHPKGAMFEGEVSETGFKGNIHHYDDSVDNYNENSCSSEDSTDKQTSKSDDNKNNKNIGSNDQNNAKAGDLQQSSIKQQQQQQNNFKRVGIAYYGCGSRYEGYFVKSFFFFDFC